MKVKAIEPEAVRELEHLYNEALARLQSAVKDKQEGLSQHRQELEHLKRALYNARKKPTGRVEKPEWKLYPDAVELPRCPQDSRFVQSFGIEDVSSAREFFDEYGFVIFQDVLDQGQCEATISEIWDYLQERTPMLDRDDASTWDHLSSERYGLPEAQTIFTPQLMANRQNPRVYAALDAILPRREDVQAWDSPHPTPNSVVVSQDRWCIYRPAADNPSWQTTGNLHLDIHPWTYVGEKESEKESMRYGMDSSGDPRFPLRDFRSEITSVQEDNTLHVQGLLNLLDNFEEDGGTRIVPGFHKCFHSWLHALGPLENNLEQSGPYDNWVLQRSTGGGSFKFSNLDPIHQLARRVPMRAGSMLIWNQLLVHGSAANDSRNFRMAQFVTGFRAGEMSPARAWARMSSIRKQVLAAGIRLQPLARDVFGVSAEQLSGSEPHEIASCAAAGAVEGVRDTGSDIPSSCSTETPQSLDGLGVLQPDAECRHFCEICQLSWDGPVNSSWEMHVQGKTHRKRVLAPRRPLKDTLAEVTTAALDASEACCQPSAPAWAVLLAPERLGARDPPAGTSDISFWPWPGTDSAFSKLVHKFVRKLCDRGLLRQAEVPLPEEGAAEVLSHGAPDSVNGPFSAAQRSEALQLCAKKASLIQEQMRKCSQQPEHFGDSEALWGYVAAKFALRAGMAFDAMTRRAPQSLKAMLASSNVRIAALGGGPAAELLAAVVARDLAGGTSGKLAVYEWVDDWRPIVQLVGELLKEQIEYHHCDISKPLDDEANAALRDAGAAFDLLIFSHVLLECGRGGGAAPLELLRDLWVARPDISHILVLDAGQARGRDCRLRPLAGSLRNVEALAAELGAGIVRVQGTKRTDGVLLVRE